MRANLRILFLALAICGLGCSGCIYHYPSEAVRRDSYQARPIAAGGLELEAHLRARSAFLMVGGDLQAESKTDGSMTIRPPEGRLGPSLASASAIDPRGYYLTAAHATKGDDILLISLDGLMRAPVKARVVWRGNESSGQDLAVVHVPRTLPAVFAWEPTVPTAGDPVYSIGPTSPAGVVSPVCYAGEIYKISAPQAALGGAVVVTYSSPAHPGDSGGPLVNAAGRLVGVNTGGRGFLAVGSYKFSIPGLRIATVGLQPKAETLRKIIEDDQAKLVGGDRASEHRE